MLPIFAIVAATVGLLLIVFLIYREEADRTAGPEKAMLGAASALVVAVAVWQVIAQMPGSGGGH